MASSRIPHMEFKSRKVSHSVWTESRVEGQLADQDVRAHFSFSVTFSVYQSDGKGV